ncbi:right-handed parallel beta-helix repeat-containing protein [Planctomycetota bacterium]
MKWFDNYRIRLVFAGFITAIVLGGIGLANGATATVGQGAGYDFDTIQAGIDAANDADTVLVAPGEYVITEPITFRGKAITVRSEAGPDQTTIRMGTPTDPDRGSVVVFENNETTDSVLDGFAITGGKGSWLVSRNEWGGGGIFFNASSGIVRNCAIVQNTAKHGGGVLCFHPCSPNLIDCTIVKNSAELGFGGGVFAFTGSSLSVTNCIIRDNSATGNMYGTGCGGGACCYRDSFMTLTNCTIAENSAGNTGGGVLYGENSSVTMTHCAIVANMGPNWGGGVASYLEAAATIRNCTIWGNSASINGGGLGCYNGASATVTNSILWRNTATTGNEIYLEQAPTEFSVTYSNVAGGQTGVSVEGGTLNWGEGNIDTDPYFADSSGGDYHLKSQSRRWDLDSQTWMQDDVTSPCIDAGDLMSPIGLEPFPNGGFVNMGAYGGTPKASSSYFGEPVCETIIAGDINGDGQVNRADLEIMALHWTDEEPLPLP